MNKNILFFIVIILIIIIVYLLSKKIRIEAGKDLDTNLKKIIYSMGLLPKEIPLSVLFSKTTPEQKEYLKIMVK